MFYIVLSLSLSLSLQIIFQVSTLVATFLCATVYGKPLEARKELNPTTPTSDNKEVASTTGEMMRDWELFINEAADINDASVKRHVTRPKRNAKNPCIAKMIYRSFYNYLFAIPVCKKSCKPKYKSYLLPTVNKTVLVVTDCYKS